jgi:hypothetical protein
MKATKALDCEAPPFDMRATYRRDVRVLFGITCIVRVYKSTSDHETLMAQSGSRLR